MSSSIDLSARDHPFFVRQILGGWVGLRKLDFKIHKRGPHD